MAISWSDAKVKFQKISGDYTDATLAQAEEDMNIGQQRFNAALGRYWSRKQQFTDIIEGQSIYQTPIDSVRLIGMTAQVSNGAGAYKVPVKEIRSEFEWRSITAYPYSSNWEAYYFMLGNDEFQLWPTPSQDVTNGIRFYYQQQDFFMSVDDIISTDVGATVTVTNGSVTVTATSGVFTAQMKGLYFQLTGVTSRFWYEIVDVPNSTTLTLKTPFVGITGSALAWRIGQTFIFPPEYDDVPIDFALARFFESKNNMERSRRYYNEDPNNLGRYNAAVQDAIQKYSSSTEGNVIFDDGNNISAWYLTPLPPTNSP